MRRLIETSKAYDDPITFSSLLMIFSHILNESLEIPSSLTKALLKQMLGLIVSWSKQERFITELLPRITELLFDLPIRRIVALYLLMSIIGIFSIKEHQVLKDIEKFMFTQNPLKSREEKTSITENNQQSKIMTYLIRSKGSLLNYILTLLFETYDSKFVSVGVCMLKYMVNALSHEFAESVVRELSHLLFSHDEAALRIDELDLMSTPTSSPDNKIIIGVCRRLLIFNELIPTMLKYALIRSDLIDKTIAMFRSIRATQTNPLVTLLEKLFLQCLKNFCTLNDCLVKGRSDMENVIYELLPSIPQMQKIMNLLSQRAIIDTHTFTSLANGSISGPLILLEYLNAIKAFVSNPIGCSIALFGDYVSTYPLSPRITICFKELIDQCHELFKINVPALILAPVISSILEIALVLTANYKEDSVISNEVVNAISCVLARDSNNLVKVVEKLNDFLVTEELRSKWIELMIIFDCKGSIPCAPIELYKSRSLDKIYESLYSDKLFSALFEDYLKPKTLKQAESIYSIKHKSVVRKWDSWVLGIALMFTYYEKLSDNWLIEHLDFLESSMISYFADSYFITANVRPRIMSFLAILSEPVKLEVEHDNLLLSIQTVKRRQRIEVEKKRSTRTKANPAALKINAFGGATPLGRKAISQPSRSISTHVDVFEGLDKGKRTPFPQPQKASAKPSTPTHTLIPPATITESRTIEHTAPPVEEKPAIPSKYQDIITLLSCYSKTTSKPQAAESFPPPIFLSNSRTSAEAIPLFQEPLTEEEKNACKRIQYLRQQKPNDPRTQEVIKGLLRQYKRIEPYVANIKKT